MPRREDVNRPHVASLTYKLESADPLLDFTATSFPSDVELGSFSGRVDDEKLTVTPREHFASPDDAMAALEPELRAWESYAEIVTGVRFTLGFTGARIIDLDAPEDARDESGYGTVRSELRIRYDIRNSPETFPSPPSFRFVETDALRRLRRVLRAQREGGYPLMGAAYDICTDLEVRYGQGDRREAARRLNVSRNVLRCLSKLSSSDDVVHRRALKTKPLAGPLSDDEATWVGQILGELVERAARIEANALPGSKLDVSSELRPLARRFQPWRAASSR